MSLTYTNPRMAAVFPDWPYGRDVKTQATFTIETHPKRGQRAVRVTLDPRTGRPSAPKTLTYADAQRIVDGDDGKTYILVLSMYGNITAMQSNMQFQEESVHEGDPRFPALRDLFGVQS